MNDNENYNRDREGSSDWLFIGIVFLFIISIGYLAWQVIDLPPAGPVAVEDTAN